MFSFYETPQRIAFKARKLGLSIDERIASGALRILWQPPTDNIVDELGARLVDAVRKTRAVRLFVDGLGGFIESAVYRERISHLFTAISNEFRVLGVTSLYSVETSTLVGPDVHVPTSGISTVAENMIFLRFVELRTHLHRVLSIMKIRDSDFDPTLREFTITNKGIRLSDTFASVEGILTGTAVEVQKDVPVKKKTHALRRRRKA
jgi:circadian clock protein KaiC